MTAQHANFRGKPLFQATKTTPKQQLNDEKWKVARILICFSWAVSLCCFGVQCLAKFWLVQPGPWSFLMLCGWCDMPHCLPLPCTTNATCDVVFFSRCAIGPICSSLPPTLYDLMQPVTRSFSHVVRLMPPMAIALCNGSFWRGN